MCQFSHTRREYSFGLRQVFGPDRIRALAYDQAAGTQDAHEYRSEEHIRAVIQNRSLWTEDSERILPSHDGNSNIVHDEAGTMYCYDREGQPT